MNKVVLYVSRGIIVQGKSVYTQQVNTKLIDLNATFITDGVRVGDTLQNINELGEVFIATVVSIVDEQEINVSENIYGQGDQEANYTITGGLEQVDLFEDETISLTSKIQDIRDISKVFTDFTQSFTIPASKTNNKIFKHFYNYFISAGAFDARKKVDSVIEINYIPFRQGKIFLNSVKMKDNKPYAYNVTFYGNTVSIKDLMGDDELSNLSYLDQFSHSYNTSVVKTGFTTGLSNESIIYPLISHTKRLYFNSDTNHSSSTIVGDLAYFDSQNPHNEDIALEYSDLKPAIKVSDIIQAIEVKYGFSFTGFFDTTPISNLYLWLSREKGRIGGQEGSRQTKVLETWTKTQGDDLVAISDDGDELTYILDSRAQSVDFDLTITPASGYEDVPYTVRTYLSGNLYSTASSQTGTTTLNTDGNGSDFYNKPIRYILEVFDDFDFTPTLEITSVDRNLNTDYEDLTCGLLSSLTEIIITTQVPEIKVIDFLTGLLKMFNLIMYYEDNRADADYGKIVVQSLDDYYDDNPKIFDITKYVESSETDIEATIPFSEIDFEYQEGKTLLMKQHKEAFNDEFGNEQFKPVNVDRGKPYKVKAPFEHFKFERLLDEADNSLTSIQWGYSAGDNFKPDADAQPQPTANYEPVLMKPALFYGIRITGLTEGNGINWNGAAHEELLNYWKPSNTNENGTSSVAPTYTLNFDNEIDEWNLTDYGGNTNSLFKVFYKTYIEDVFNPKKRIFKLTAHLPSSILLNYKLNDRFQIGDKVFTINSIDVNLKTGESKLELLNRL